MEENKNKKDDSLQDKYMDLIKERKSEKRVTTSHQITGLKIAKLLDDEKHKGLYIKLAKENDESFLLEIARDVSDRENIENKGAYFMKVLQNKKDKHGNN